MRLFIGVKISMTAVEAVAGAAEAMRAASAGVRVRWVAPATYHVTLKFLGEARPEVVPAVRDAVGALLAGKPSFEFATRGAGAFPSPERARVLWVGVEDGSGSLEEIAARLEKVLEEINFPPERRRYHAHLTLARVASQKNVRGFLGEFRDSDFEPLEFTASEVVVMQSELLPEGARYHKLHAAPFGAAGE